MLKFTCRQAYRVPKGHIAPSGISRPARDISRRQAYRSKEISRSEGAFTICGVPPHDMFALQTRYTPAAYDMFTAVNAEAAYCVPRGTFRAAGISLPEGDFRRYAASAARYTVSPHDMFAGKHEIRLAPRSYTAARICRLRMPPSTIESLTEYACFSRSPQIALVSP